LLTALGQLPPRHPDHGPLRARIIEKNMPLATRLSRRYAGRGERLDDLAQVAALALVRAVDGYDPTLPYPFVGYATPTILGALKRHFRDTAWDMRVPRSAQELLHRMGTSSADLTHLRGRHPNTAELADHMNVTVGQVRSATRAAGAYHLRSLNTPGVSGSDDLIDLVGGPDTRYAEVDERLSPPLVSRLVATLPARERQIIALRFSQHMTQTDIAAEVGISQMHVSRLLRRSLAQLRAGLPAPTRGEPVHRAGGSGSPARTNPATTSKS
jgi:RNA polymerase sigma-B factor